ncbi:hypothetical protein SUDANB70_05781 [Streptomyces sp. enrichment culture]
MPRSPRTPLPLAGPPAAAGTAPVRRPGGTHAVPAPAPRPADRTVPQGGRRTPARALPARHLPQAPWACAAARGARGAA